MVIGKIKVGHWHDKNALTGCTVFLLPDNCAVSCEVRGGAPGTRETELLRPMFTVQKADAVLFTGGSAFGLAAAQGVAKYLEEMSVGFPTPAGPVPIVSAAVIYDLDLGDSKVRPGPEEGYEACFKANIDEFRDGCVGVGAGATVGNVLGRVNSTKSGLGFYRFRAGGFMLEVAAVVNSLGEIVGEGGEILAGARGSRGKFVSAEDILISALGSPSIQGQNTTLVLIATNARLTGEERSRVALQGHNGIARAVRPSHTRYDGDTVYVVATQELNVSIDAVEALAAKGCAEAIRTAVLRAESAGGIPACCDILE